MKFKVGMKVVVSTVGTKGWEGIRPDNVMNELIGTVGTITETENYGGTTIYLVKGWWWNPWNLVPLSTEAL